MDGPRMPTLTAGILSMLDYHIHIVEYLTLVSARVGVQFCVDRLMFPLIN